MRNEKLDLLKGIAILLVVMGHSMSDVVHMTHPFNIIYSFHMPLLFYLSGYLLEEAKGKYEYMGKAAFIKKKAVSLLVPYASWTVLIPWILSVCDIQVFRESLVNLTGIKGGGIWFLPVLFGLDMMYLFVWVLQSYAFKKKTGFLMDVLQVIIAVMVLIVLAVITKYPYLINMLSYSIPFFFGIYVKRYEFISNIVQSKWCLIFSVIVYILLFSFFDFYDTSALTQLKRIILSSFMIVILWNICRKETYNTMFSEVIKMFGKYSLAIYLIHGYFSKWKQMMFKVDSLIGGIVLSFVMSSMVCLLCVLIARGLEKFKVTRKILFGK